MNQFTHEIAMIIHIMIIHRLSVGESWFISNNLPLWHICSTCKVGTFLETMKHIQ
eukprot:jgi/Botrbrau1/8602/Bobra.0196s0002.1